jgi:hypothetical protein
MSRRLAWASLLIVILVGVALLGTALGILLALMLS